MQVTERSVGGRTSTHGPRSRRSSFASSTSSNGNGPDGGWRSAAESYGDDNPSINVDNQTMQDDRLDPSGLSQMTQDIFNKAMESYKGIDEEDLKRLEIFFEATLAASTAAAKEQFEKQFAHSIAALSAQTAELQSTVEDLSTNLSELGISHEVLEENHKRLVTAHDKLVVSHHGLIDTVEKRAWRNRLKRLPRYVSDIEARKEGARQLRGRCVSGLEAGKYDLKKGAQNLAGKFGLLSRGQRGGGTKKRFGIKLGRKKRVTGSRRRQPQTYE